MKPILPKRTGATQTQGIYTSPRTAIILTPAAVAGASTVPLGTSLSSPLILPSPPTFTITLAAPQGLQPTPVILPLTRTTALSTNARLQCTPIAPKISSVTDLKEQQASTIFLKGKDPKRDMQWKSNGRGNGRLYQKCSSHKTPILPKRSQPEPQTVILLPSTPERKTSELPSSGLVPEYSLVISSDALQQTTVQEKKMIKNASSNVEDKFNKVKTVHKHKSLLNKLDRNKTHRNQTKTVNLKLLKKKNVDSQSSAVAEASKVTSSDANGKDMREASSLLEGSTCLSEAISLSPEGSSHQPGPSPNQDVLHYPPPPYPQDKVAKRVIPITHHTKTNKSYAMKAQEDASDPSTRLLHMKRNKYDGKNKRHDVAEGLSIESSSTSLTNFRSDSSSISNSNDNSTSSIHMPVHPLQSTTGIQPLSTVTSASNLSLNETTGKISSSTAAETSSYLSSPIHSHSPEIKNRNIPPSVSETHTNHKGPPHHEHYSFPTPSTSLEDQTSLSPPTKSSHKKSCEYSYQLQPATPGISGPCVTTNSSLPCGPSTTESASHTSYCSQTPTGSHLPQSPVCSLPSLYSDVQEASSAVPPTSGVLSCEPKSEARVVLPHTSLHMNENTQHTHSSFSPHLDICDQTQDYSQSPHCSSGLPSVLHTHPPNTSTEANFTNSSPFLSSVSSQNQSIQQKSASHSSSYAESPQQNTYPLQPTCYMESSQMTSFKPPQSLMNSPQPPSYTQSSRPSPYSRSEAAYLQPTHSSPLCTENQQRAHLDCSSQVLSFSSRYSPSLHSSSQGQTQTQPSHMFCAPMENASTAALCKDNSQSPIPPPYHVSDVVPSSQYYSDSPGLSYPSERVNIAHDSHYSSLGKSKPSSSSSLLGVSSSHVTMETSLSPPSYEAHLQSSASYITSSGSAQLSQDNLQHGHHRSSTNYTFSSHIGHGSRSQPLHEETKKSASSNCSSLLSLPPPPKYNYCQDLTPEDQHIDHSLIADITQGTYNYDIEESSESFYHSSTTETPLPLLTEGQPPNSIEHRAINSHVNVPVASHGVQNSDGIHPRQQSSQSRLLIYPLGKPEAPSRNSDQDDLVFSSWSSLTQSTEQCDNLRVEKLWFIPHQEQNHAYLKESSKYLSNDGLQSSKDLMLKKFWIEEDEPIAEEIISSLPQKSQQQEQLVEDQEKVTLHQFPSPQYPASKKYKAKQMLCQICGKVLKGHKSLRSHLNSHYNIQPHSCPTCTKKFTNRSVLVEHLRIHSGETPYLCSLCGRAFRTRSGLMKHKSIHTSARPFECSMCSKKFKTKVVLHQHMKLHLTGMFTCSVCGKTFERHRALAVHKAFHHHKSQRFECPVCHKGYHFRSLLNQHMQLHSNVQKHVCTVCRKSFVWRSGLVAHMKTHSASRPKCDICDMHFASVKRLESHYQRHTNLKPHQCKVCGKNFSHAYRLASHSIVHEDNKDYRCKTCDIVFTNAKKYKKHVVTHKSEEPRICRLSGTVVSATGGVLG